MTHWNVSVITLVAPNGKTDHCNITLECKPPMWTISSHPFSHNQTRYILMSKNLKPSVTELGVAVNLSKAMCFASLPCIVFTPKPMPSDWWICLAWADTMWSIVQEVGVAERKSAVAQKKFEATSQRLWICSFEVVTLLKRDTASLKFIPV